MVVFAAVTLAASCTVLAAAPDRAEGRKADHGERGHGPAGPPQPGKRLVPSGKGAPKTEQGKGKGKGTRVQQMYTKTRPPKQKAKEKTAAGGRQTQGQAPQVASVEPAIAVPQVPSSPAPAPAAGTTPPAARAPTSAHRRAGSQRRSSRTPGRPGRPSTGPRSTTPRSGSRSGAEAALFSATAQDAARRLAGSSRDGHARSRAESGSPVGRTVRELVQVVPQPVKMLLAALAVLTIVLGGGYLLTSARARRLDRQRADLLQEVGLLQTALLPPVPATVGSVRTSVAYRPSDGPGAGGDFYDALTLPGGRAAFILGDVSGHGRQALARTAFMRYTLRAYLEAGLEPRMVLQVAGRVVDEHLGGNFATVVVAVHDPLSGSITYACAGHPPPVVVGPTRSEPVLAASAPPIGLGLRTGVRQTTVPLPSGSVVCLYTDGLAEARTETGILGRPRLGDLVEEMGRDATAAGLLDLVADEARLVTDDMATVVLSPTAGITAGGFRSEQLEIDTEEAEGPLPERFLEACGVDPSEAHDAVDRARAMARGYGGAVLHVHFGIRGPQAQVLPRTIEGLEVASRARAQALGTKP